MAVRPLTDAERAEILRRHAAGETRNQIVAATGRSAGTVSNVVAATGLSFARAPEVVAATEARKIDNKVRRVAIVDRLYTRTEAVLDRLEAEQYLYVLAGPDGPETIRAEHPPAQDERHLSTSISGYLATAARLEAVDAGDGAVDARSMLGALAEGIRRIAGEDATGEG
jgi:hypothetical protein